MKVLLQNRPRELWLGGDIVQLDKTLETLNKKGIQAEYNGQAIYSPALLYRKFDLVHLFNFSMKWTKIQLYIAKLHKKPVVCSMIYHQGENFVDYKTQQLMIDQIDKLIFLTPGEIERARRHLIIPEEKIVVIPNGIDAFWFQEVPKTTIDDYVLTVGRIEESKGQLAVAKACKKLGLKYICVGQIVEYEYAQLCEAFGATILPAMEPKDLIKVYANCRLFALVSRAEIFPLTVMEAGAQAKNIVLTDHCEWKDIPNVSWAKYNDKDSIEMAINFALLKKPNIELQEKLKQMTWESVADNLIKVYESLVMDKA